MVESTVRKRATNPSRLVERPRLTRALDASRARVLLLLAPAGYGKTTLARQWFGQGDKQVVWYRATQASSDVAALAAGLARAATELVPTAADRVIQVIRNSAAPARDVEEIAEVLVEELSPFPRGGWIAIDDYHYLVGSAAAERLVEVLADRAGPRLLLATRRRPRWATARRSLYGEISETDQAALAFTVEEAAPLLPHVQPSKLSDFVDRAKGWPAVIRLASVSGRQLPELELPPALHQYFAEELFQAATPALQDALTRLALLPSLRPDVLELVLGPAHHELCTEAVALGFLTDGSAADFEFHPLLRTFLMPKARQIPQVTALGQELAAKLIANARWDEAFALVINLQRADFLPAVFEKALDDLLKDSRVSTLEKWVEYATQCAADFPLLELAEAEIARRLGDYDVGEVRALQAARTLEDGSTFRSRAWAVAGECANLASRPTNALRYHKEAERLALSTPDARRAVWGQHVVAVQFEIADAHEPLSRLKILDDGTAAANLRILTGELNLAILEGGCERAVAVAARHTHLLERANNSLITTGFLSRLAWTCIICGQYGRGAQYAEEGIAEAERKQALFALIHFASALVATSIGLRRFRHAKILLDEVEQRLREKSNLYEALNVRILRARLLIATGLPDLAAVELDGELIEEAPTPALQLEAAAVRALALAVTGDAAEALVVVEQAHRASSESQGVVLSQFANFIQADVLAGSDAPRLLATAMESLKTTQNYDSFVQAYRAYPPLLQKVVVERLLPQNKLRAVVRSAMDTKCASAAGFYIEPPQSPHDALLTRREREVYALLCRGLSNREIADALVITESTAKVHVRHILKKLGVTTRARAMHAAQEAL